MSSDNDPGVTDAAENSSVQTVTSEEEPIISIGADVDVRAQTATGLVPRRLVRGQ